MPHRKPINPVLHAPQSESGEGKKGRLALLS